MQYGISLMHVPQPLLAKALISKTEWCVGAGNKQNTLYFETARGQLTVQRLSHGANGMPIIQITLPKSDSSSQLPHGLELNIDLLKVPITCHHVMMLCRCYANHMPATWN